MPAPANDDRILSALGANIRRERSARGVTQEKLAEVADLNIRTVQKIESGSLNVLIYDASPNSARPWMQVGQASAAFWINNLRSRTLSCGAIS